MAKNNAATDPNPCAKKETDDKDASKDVLEKTRQRDLAWKNLNTLKDTIDPAEWTAIRRQLNFGDWPEDVLGPFNNPVHNYTTLVNAAKAVYNAIQALKEAQDAANAARDALRAHTVCVVTTAHQIQRDHLREWRKLSGGKSHWAGGLSQLCSIGSPVCRRS